MKKRLLLVAVIAAFVCGNASAQGKNQKENLESYSFIEAQGGAQLTFTNADMKKLVTPVGAFSLGHYFSPVVGVRIHANGWQAKSGFKNIDKYYKWKYVTTDMDLMLNLSNLFCNNKWHALNVILVCGYGLTAAWDNNDIKDIQSNYTVDAPLAWNKNRLSHNIRGGLRLETDMSKMLGVSLEVDANSLSDRFNSKTNDHDDWMVTGMLGVSFRFGHKYKKVAPAPVPEPAPTPAPEPVKVVEPAPTPAPEPVKVVEPETIHKEIFYMICKADATPEQKIKEVADFMQRNPNAKVTIVSYADKGTGTPKINMDYSKKRAEQARDMLVKKFGADASRISIDYKGDTIQPFSDNDKNRCTIIDGK
jgi:OmpA-OmpF porin, OOP family